MFASFNRPDLRGGAVGHGANVTTEFPCASCAKPIKFSASKCPHCGHKVSQADIEARRGGSEIDGKALLGCIGVPALIAIAAYMIWPSEPSGGHGSNGGQQAETYRLVHALGNTEREVSRGLSRSECQVRRDELKATATALGTYNEATGYGSITCQPESTY